MACCENKGGASSEGGAAIVPPSLAFPLLLAVCFSGSVREGRNGLSQLLPVTTTINQPLNQVWQHQIS